MTNDIISISSAIQAAADYAGFSTEDIRCTEKHYANGLFEIGSPRRARASAWGASA